MKKDSKKNKYMYKTFIGISIVLSLLNVVQFYLYKGKQKDYKEERILQRSEIFLTYTKLDSISDQLQKKIVEIESLGGDIDSLLLITNQLEEDKKTLKNVKDLAIARYNNIQEKVSAYEYLLKRKDEEILKLKEVNQELFSEVNVLKTQHNELNNEITQLKQDKEELSDKIESASTLKATNIKFSAINSKGKKRKDEEFRVRNLSTLVIDFNIDDNPLAQKETKEIILRIVEPMGSILYQTDSSSKTFNYKGKDLFFSLNQNILFDNSQQQVTFKYLKGNKFKKGKYSVEIYCENEKIGHAHFSVK